MLTTHALTDFTSLFNWNTKQLFVWVEATYPSLTPDGPESRAVIWDKIINSHAQQNTPWTEENLRSYLPFLPSSGAKSKISARKARSKGNTKPGKISLKNIKPKYQITDVSGRLAERQNVTLEVHWNVQPWVGLLTWTIPQGQSFIRWNGIKGGRSKAFDMPPLKAKKPEVVNGKAGKPKAGKAEPVAGHQH